MAYDSVRAQLDKLLGPDRNGPINPSNAKKAPHYTDDSVCKFYLLGFCPNDLHIKHRSEPGSCPNLHSDAAKAAFEKDDAAGKLRRERVRWTRELLRECRSILYDEDRKIRGHARRLQETYNATGDLSGLMIRNFETLKKLGMVGKNAKIRILSEMDDMEDFDDQSDQPDKRTEEEPRPAVGTNPKSAPKKEAEPAKTNAVSAEGEGDDDDMDGFGIVQVIPASGSPSGTVKDGKDTTNASKRQSEEEVDEFGRIKVTNKKPDETQEEPKSDVKSSEPIAFDDDDDDGFGIIKIIPGNSNRDDSSDDEDDAPSKDQEKEKTATSGLHGKEGSPVGNKHVSKAEDKSADGKDGSSPAAATGKDKSTSDGPESNDAETQPDDGKEGDSDTLNPEQVMEKFYETGKGPDGLLMLDKKQSLRVCQCCGGYISLVDAESRLLSHYGGKSHHSLAQLRAKVPELEEHLANCPAHFDEDPSRSGPRWSERDADRARRENDRHRRGGYHDRNAGRSSADAEDGRGYGTTTWYSGAGRSDEAYREHGRRDDDRYRHDDRRRDDRRRDDRYRSDGRYGDRQRYDDRFRGDRSRADGRHRDERFRDDRYGGDDRYGRDDRYSRDHRQRDDRGANERYHDDRSRNRDGGRYDSGRKRQRSTSPPRNNRRSRRQY